MRHFYSREEKLVRGFNVAVAVKVCVGNVLLKVPISAVAAVGKIAFAVTLAIIKARLAVAAAHRFTPCCTKHISISKCGALGFPRRFFCVMDIHSFFDSLNVAARIHLKFT